eukprot:7466482-Lingulodinium_polyedra.AAC.1
MRALWAWPSGLLSTRGLADQTTLDLQRGPRLVPLPLRHPPRATTPGAAGPNSGTCRHGAA